MDVNMAPPASIPPEAACLFFAGTVEEVSKRVKNDPELAARAAAVVLEFSRTAEVTFERTVDSLKETIRNLQLQITKLDVEAVVKNSVIERFIQGQQTAAASAPVPAPVSAPAMGPFPPPGRTHTPPLSEKLPDPEKYNGVRGQLRSFVGQLRMKLRHNADRFSSEESRVVYAISRMERSVVSVVAPLLDAGTLPCDTLEELVTLLERAFGDPDRQGTAKRELNALKQRNRDFHQYLADFQRIMADLQYSDQAKTHALVDGLSSELQQALVTQVLPQSFDEYVSLLVRLDNQQRLFSRFSSASATPPRRYPTPPTQPPVAAPVADRSFAEPMDLSRRRGPLSAVERQRRQTEGLCLYCGQPGHLARGCPNNRMTASAALVDRSPSPSPPPPASLNAGKAPSLS